MNFFYKNIFILILSLFFFQNLFADNSYYIDFSKVLNESKAGADAQKKLRDKYESELAKFQKEEEKIKKEEIDLISKKKALSNEEYLKKINELRSKVALIQKNKQNSFNSIAKSRSEAKETLLKSLNPILKKYMQDNKISIVLNKQSVLLGDASFEITNNIIELLNKELISINVN